MTTTDCTTISVVFAVSQSVSDYDDPIHKFENGLTENTTRGVWNVTVLEEKTKISGV